MYHSWIAQFDLVESLPTCGNPLTASSWSQLRRNLQPAFEWVGIFQIARPSCRDKSGAHLSYLQRGVRVASEVPLKVPFVLSEEVSDVRFVMQLESPPWEALFRWGNVPIWNLFGDARVLCTFLSDRTRYIKIHRPNF